MSRRIYRVGSTYYIDLREGSLRLRRSLQTADLAEATRLANAIATPVHASYGSPAPIDIKRRLQRMRERSKSRGEECSMTERDLELLIRRAGGRCEVTGVPFSAWKLDHWSKAPYAISIDRIDGRLPYSFQNCRIVCNAVNVAINEWGAEVFAELAAGASAMASEQAQKGSVPDTVEITHLISDT